MPRKRRNRGARQDAAPGPFELCDSGGKHERECTIRDARIIGIQTVRKASSGASWGLRREMMYAMRSTEPETRAIFVTSNENKRREASGILGFELRSESPEVTEIQALDLREVAAEKAREAHRALGSPDAPVLVEDSGLVVEAWEGLPGAFTKWFMVTVGNEGLCGMLRDGLSRDARAVCVVAIANISGTAGGVEVFTGEVRGSLADSPRGEGGFGWDAIFIPEGETRTYAEMGDAKHADSHRARAFNAARERLAGYAANAFKAPA